MAQKSRSQYVMSLLNVLQKNNSSITKVEAVEQVIKDLKIDDEELSKLTPTGASKVTTEIGWARQGLCYGGYIDNSQRGV